MSHFAKGLVLLILLSGLLAAPYAAAQHAVAPDPAHPLSDVGDIYMTTLSTVAPLPVIHPPPPAPAAHAFWDRTNVLLFSGVAATRALDYASTRNFEARGRKEILLPQDVVDNAAGFASLEVAATLTSVGISYWLHRTGHHKLERWMSIGHIGVTAFGDVRNYALESRHAQ